MEKATNLSSMRKKNQKMILSLLRQGKRSRASLARQTGLTKAAVSIITDELIKDGFIRECGAKHKGNVGRAPVMLEICDDCIYVIGINITRKNTSIGLCDVKGNVFYENAFETGAPYETFREIGKNIKDISAKAKAENKNIYKISVSVPGPVDAEKMLILNPPNFTSWHNVNIFEYLRKYTDLEIVFENVSKATAVSQKHFGNGGIYKNFLTLLVDDGVGSGLVLDGALFKGNLELGHTTIDYNGIACECGNKGCLEKYAAIPCILKGTKYKSWKEVVDGGDEHVLDRQAQYLSAAIVSANNLFNLEAVILCGKVSYNPEKLLECIVNKISDATLINKKPKVESGIQMSQILVAASLAVNDFFEI